MQNKLFIHKLLAVNSMGPHQKTNTILRMCTELVLNGAVGITGNIRSSEHAASTIGSLTCRYSYEWKRCNRTLRGKMIEEN